MDLRAILSCGPNAVVVSGKETRDYERGFTWGERARKAGIDPIRDLAQTKAFQLGYAHGYLKMVRLDRMHRFPDARIPLTYEEAVKLGAR